MGSNGVQKTSKTAEKLGNRLFHKNLFFYNFELNMGGLGVSGGMAWTMRTDFLEVWWDLVLHGMGEVDFHVWPTWTYEYNQLIFRKGDIFFYFTGTGTTSPNRYFLTNCFFCFFGPPQSMGGHPRESLSNHHGFQRIGFQRTGRSRLSRWKSKVQWGPTNWKNLAKSETPKSQETLHNSGPGLIKMGFW